MSTAYGAGAPGDIAGVVATVGYSQALAIPGSGNDSSVCARVTNVSGVNGLFQATDSDTTIRIGLVSIAASIPPGPFVRVVFDCANGTVPAPSALTCTLEASTLDGTLLSGATCTTEIL